MSINNDNTINVCCSSFYYATYNRSGMKLRDYQDHIS
uniref:Uncharacterized protein n=1 Tax=Anguilla anguilla TaxID=7936 RepID=A0A0E9U7E1_ANGAN